MVLLPSFNVLGEYIKFPFTPLVLSLTVTPLVNVELLYEVTVVLTKPEIVGAMLSFFICKVAALDLFPALSYVYAVIVLVPSCVIFKLVPVVSPLDCAPLTIYVVLSTFRYHFPQ